MRAAERRQAAAVEQAQARAARESEEREAAIRDAAAREAAQRREPAAAATRQTTNQTTTEAEGETADGPRHGAGPQEPSGYQGEPTGSYWSQNRYPSQSTSDPNAR